MSERKRPTPYEGVLTYVPSLGREVMVAFVPLSAVQMKDCPYCIFDGSANTKLCNTSSCNGGIYVTEDEALSIKLLGVPPERK